MDIRVHTMCRGSGKLFFNLDIRGLDDDAFVVIGACTCDKREVPCMAFPEGASSAMGECSRARSFYVVLPQVQVGLTLVVHALDAVGNLVATARYEISAQSVKWQSRLNGVVFRKQVGSLRNCEKERTIGRVVFQLNDAPRPIELQNPLRGKSMVRGVAKVPCDLAENLPIIRCLDGALDDYPDAVSMWPARVVDSSQDVTAPYWEIAFTAPVPVGAGAVFAAYDEQSDMWLGGFEALEPWGIDELSKRALYMFGTARWDPRWHDVMTEQHERASQRAQHWAGRAGEGPSFSIVVPLFRTPLPLFHDMVSSVRAQGYPHWQLVLVNASPDDAQLGAAVAEACAADVRITVVELPENRGITLNTKAGIERAEGDFVAFFDHDDVLEPDILAEYTRAISNAPDTDVLYCDEDKLSPEGRYVEPFFKPDFSVDLLRANNYICHMLCIRAELLFELMPAWDAEYDGAQDYCLTLMATERARKVHHVPKVLYHWRQAEGSAASDGNKSYAQQAGQLALERHLERRGLRACVSEGAVPFTYRVDYAVEGDPFVSIVIPSCDHVDMLDACLRSIDAKTTYGNYEVVIVENNSSQEQTFAYYERAQQEFSHVRVVRWQGSGFNYSELVNFGVAQAHGDYLVLLNNDVEVITPGWIEGMLGLCQRDDVGVVGVQLLYPDDTVQHAGVVVTADAAEHLYLGLRCEDQGYFASMCHVQDLSAVTAACLMTKRSLLDEVGGFDADLAVAYNDVDFCLKSGAAGKLVVYTPHVQLRHYESASRGAEGADEEAKARFLRERDLLRTRWAHVYEQGDPYFNPNLSQVSPSVRYYQLR